MWFLLLSCVGTKTPEVQPDEAAQVRVITGPWEHASALALAATGPRSVDGGWSGPTIILAAWVLDEELWATTSLDSGRGWTPPTKIADDVQVGDEGQAVPRLGIALGRPVVAYDAGGVPMLAERRAEGWKSAAIGDVAGPIALEIVDDEPSVSWVSGDTLMLDGVAVAEDVCPDSRPAISRQGKVAWRVAEGVQLDGELQPLGGGCVADGPVFDGEILVVAAEGVIHRGGEPLETLLEGWSAAQPRAAGGQLAWLELQDGQRRAVLAGTGLFTADQLVLGDPVAVAGELWLPFDSGKPTVAAWSPPRSP